MPSPPDILSRICPDAESRSNQQAYSVMRGWAEIEPLGVVPEHRGRGLAIALTHEAIRLVAERGGHTVFINTAPLPNYPAPWQAYLRAGFTARDRGLPMTQRRTLIRPRRTQIDPASDYASGGGQSM